MRIKILLAMPRAPLGLYHDDFNLLKSQKQVLANSMLKLFSGRVHLAAIVRNKFESSFIKATNFSQKNNQSLVFTLN